MAATVDTYTLTFGDQAENHAGMQKIGTAARCGYTVADLQCLRELFTIFEDVSCEVVSLNSAYKPFASGYCKPGRWGYVSYQNVEPAAVLIIRDGVRVLGSDPDAMLAEQRMLEYDKKAFMWGRVVEKHARHNICFDEEDQIADYPNKKGTIVGYSHVPVLKKFRDNLAGSLGEKALGLVVEGNHYYDVEKCGIGFHGDSERKVVIGVRLGASIPLDFQWFLLGKPAGDRVSLMLNHGDVYIMSEKAVGHDWKKKKLGTLRHAAGALSFRTIKEAKQPKAAATSKKRPRSE